jgi:hypothetical protein
VCVGARMEWLLFSLWQPLRTRSVTRSLDETGLSLRGRLLSLYIGAFSRGVEGLNGQAMGVTELNGFSVVERWWGA